MKKAIKLILGCGAMSVLLSHCGNMVLPEMPAPESVPAANPGVAGSASGVWSGVVNYTAYEGSNFEIPMRFTISSSQDRVTSVAGDSEPETVAAQRSGNLISWSMLGSRVVTEVTLKPVSGGTARVTSRIIEDGKVMATGGGVFARRG